MPAAPSAEAAAAAEAHDVCCEPEGLDALLAAMQRGPASLQSLAAAALSPPPDPCSPHSPTVNSQAHGHKESHNHARSHSSSRSHSRGQSEAPASRDAAAPSPDSTPMQQKAPREGTPADVSELYTGASPPQNPGPQHPKGTQPQPLSPASSLSLAIAQHVADAAILTRGSPRSAAADSDDCSCCNGRSSSRRAARHDQAPVHNRRAGGRQCESSAPLLFGAALHKGKPQSARSGNSSEESHNHPCGRGRARRKTINSNESSDCSICTAISPGVPPSRPHHSHVPSGGSDMNTPPAQPAAWAAEYSPMRRDPQRPARTTVDTGAGPEASECGSSCNSEGQQPIRPSLLSRRPRGAMAGAKRRCIASTPSGTIPTQDSAMQCSKTCITAVTENEDLGLSVF